MEYVSEKQQIKINIFLHEMNYISNNKTLGIAALP